MSATRSTRPAFGDPGTASRQRHMRRSIHRVGARHRRCNGLITSSVIDTAISMSPRTATPGEMRPRNVRSVLIRPMCIAKSVAMNASVHPASIGARVFSLASTSAASAATSDRSDSPSWLTTVSFASAVVYTGAAMMFQPMPKIRSAPAIATTHVNSQPRAKMSSSTTAALPSAGRTAMTAARCLTRGRCRSRSEWHPLQTRLPRRIGAPLRPRTGH